MTDANPRLHSTLERKIRRARLVIAANRIWPALWLPASVAGIFVLVSLAGLWGTLPYLAHVVLLWGFGLAFAAALIPLIRLRWPTRQQALRRLETVSGLPHRPASSYEDQLTAAAPSGFGATGRIWAAHRQRTALLFSRLRAGWPHPRTDRYDPLALRAALVLLLVVAFAARGHEARERLLAAFQFGLPGSTLDVRVDAWITPPVYTGRSPLMLADGAKTLAMADTMAGALSVPEGSALTIRVNHPDAAAFALKLTPDDRRQARELTAKTSGDRAGFAEFAETLGESVTAELTNGGGAMARWRIAIEADRVPSIALTEPLSKGQRGALRFRYRVEDDYGVVSARAHIDLVDAEAEKEPRWPGGVTRLGEPPVVPLTLPRANLKAGEGQTYTDLTAHPWAGLQVTVILEARDHAGQVGRSVPQTITLPERVFTKPLARALVEQRRKLVERPYRRDRVARALDALSLAPEKYIEGKGIYLGIRTAYWRLTHNADQASVESVVDQLWSMALQIEDGDLSDAERELRAAQEALMKALEENAPEEELQRLMEELRTALNRFLQSLAQQARDNKEFDVRHDPLSPDQLVTSQELEEMLRNIENLAKTGSKDAARQLLSELRDILENVQTGQQGRSGESEQMMSLLDGLSELITQQQRLLDETFRAQQEMERGDDGTGSESARPGEEDDQGSGQGTLQGLEQRQRALRDKLDQLVDELRALSGQAPGNLDDAGRAMGEAGKALGEENAARATEQQTLALDRMRQGAQALAEQMMNAMQRMGRGQGRSRDPLGRRLPRQHSDGSSDANTRDMVPGEPDVRRAREILDELRRRLGESTRPPTELDYLERLIRRF